jgi:AraC family transcriptional regulator
MDVQIKDKAERRVAALRHIGPYNQIGEAFMRLDSIARSAGLAKPGAQMIAIYHDDPAATPKDQLRSDAAISIAPGEKLPDGLTEQRVPAGRYACAIHAGPYEQLGDTWARFMGEWLPASGHRPGTGVSHEIYLNNPGTEPDKQKLRTELCIPVSS